MTEYIDVWFKFDSDEDENPTLEAFTRVTDTGYAIDWCHVDVGKITSTEFDTLSDAYDWYERNGFLVFSS